VLRAIAYSPYWSSLGGGERYFLTLLEILSRRPGTRFTVAYQDPMLDKHRLEQFYHIDLSKIDFQRFEGGSADLVRLTRGTDLFICMLNFRSVPSASKKCVQILQIPYGKIGVASVSEKLLHGKVKEAVKDLYRLRLLADSKTKADLILTYSDFVANALKGNFGVNSSVLYPSIHDFKTEGISKKKIICSAGRFFSGLYNNKRYDIMTKAFRIASPQLPGWEYHLAGSMSKDSATSRMLKKLEDDNRGFPVFFHFNVSFEELGRLYNEASIFWHAAGYQVDEVAHPENVEHFGITTVEAMGAQAIPVAINRGGQKEIITEGVDGFLWETIDELVEKTVLIARMPENSLARLRANASRRREYFDLSNFQQRAFELIGPLLTV